MKKKMTTVSEPEQSMFNIPVPEILEKKGISIISIASGSTGNCYFIEIGNHPFLIDMGIGIRKIKKALEVNQKCIENIEAIFVTHAHYDHISSAKAILNNIHCPVYGHKWTIEKLQKYDGDHYELNPEEKTVLFHGLTVKCFDVNHDCPGTLGYVFECKDARLGLVTDNGEMNETIYEMLEGVDVLIIESNHDVELLKENRKYPYELKQRILSKSGHLSNIQCGEALVRFHDKGTRNFLLAHLSKENNTPDLALDTAKLILREKQANIYICPVEGSELLEY